jgi:hypothetical protein
MRTWNNLIGVAALLCALAGCEAPPEIGFYADPNANFSAFDSYNWGAGDTLPRGDPRLDNNPFFDASVKQAVEQQLNVKGLQKAEPASADLLVHYHINISERMDIAEIDRRYMDCAEEGCEPSIVVFDEGTLIVDFVDARSERLVWRGWMRGPVPPGIIGDQAALDVAVREAVPQILANYGPRT